MTTTPMNDEELQLAADKAGLHAVMLGNVQLLPRGLLVAFAREIEAHHGIESPPAACVNKGNAS